MNTTSYNRRRQKIYRIGLAGLAFTLLAYVLFLPAAASAHPLGNFSLNHYSRLEIGAAGIKLYYVMDIAEIPTFQDKDLLDTNRDGQISESEKQAYLDIKLKEVTPGLKLALDYTAAPLKLVQKNIEFPAGQGGLGTTRITALFETAALPSGAANLTF